MQNVKTNLNKFPKTILEQSEEMLKNSTYSIEVETDHSITYKFKEDKDVSTTLVFNSEGNLINYTCNCGKISLCKHVGAALLLLENRKNASCKAKLEYRDFFKTCFKNGSQIYYRSNEIRKSLTSLLEIYSEESIVECLLDALFDDPFKYKDTYFINFFNFYEYSKLTDDFVSLLKNFLRALIKEYADDSYRDLIEGESIFYKFFESQIYGSDLIADVFYESLNNGLFPKNDVLCSYLSTETYYSTKDEIELTLNGLETIYKNKDFLNYRYPISNESTDSLLTQIVNSDDVYKYAEMAYEIIGIFCNDEDEFLKDIFLHIYNQKDKELDGKKIIKLLSKNCDVIAFIDESLPMNEDTKVWHSMVEALGASYFVYSRASSKQTISRLASNKGNITLAEIVHLLKEHYPFKNHKNFFSKKNILLCEEGETLNHEFMELCVKLIIINSTELLPYPSLIKPIADVLKEVPTDIIENLFIELSDTYPSRFFQFELLDKLGFKGVK